MLHDSTLNPVHRFTSFAMYTSYESSLTVFNSGKGSTA
jgi:hypothetical protein